MSTRNIHHPRARLKALGHDPRLHIFRPASISTRPLHNLNAAVKPIPAIRHRRPLLNAQNETRSSGSALEPQKSMGRGRRIRYTFSEAGQQLGNTPQTGHWSKAQHFCTVEDRLANYT
jgi:hypothetical protein